LMVLVPDTLDNAYFGIGFRYKNENNFFVYEIGSENGKGY